MTHQYRAVASRTLIGRWCVMLSIALLGLMSQACDTIGLKVSRVPTSSMAPAYAVGDYLWWHEIGPDEIEQLTIGDIILFLDPSVGGDPVFKRVVGLAGDTVEIRDSQLWVSGTHPDESWATHQCVQSDCAFGPVAVPADRLCVLGDNWDNSKDSRWYGTISEDAVVGKAVEKE